LAMVIEQFTRLLGNTENDDFTYLVIKKLVENGSSVRSVIHDISQSSLEPLFFLLFSRNKGPVPAPAVLNNHLKVYTIVECGTLTSTHQYLGALSSNSKSKVWKNTFHYLCQKGATLSDKICCWLIQTALNSSSLTYLSRLIEQGIVKPELINYKELYNLCKKCYHNEEVMDRLLIYTRASIEEFGPSVVPRQDWDKIPPMKDPNKLGSVVCRVPTLKAIARCQVRRTILAASGDRGQMNMNSLIDLIPLDSLPTTLKGYLKMDNFHGLLEKE